MGVLESVWANVEAQYVQDPESSPDAPRKIPLHMLKSAQDPNVPPGKTRSMFLPITSSRWNALSTAEQRRLNAQFRVIVQVAEGEEPTQSFPWSADTLVRLNNDLPIAEAHGKLTF